MTVAFVFPGQGSQAVGMGKALAEAFAPARRVFEEVDAALGERLSDIIWNGPAETLTLTENAQPALMAVSLAAMRVLEAEAGVDLKRDAPSLPDIRSANIRRLPRRGRFRSPMRRGSCASAAAPCRKRFRSASAPWLRSSASNSTRSKRSRPRRRAWASAPPPTIMAAARSCLSGEKSAVERAVEVAKARGAKRAMLLPVSAPFHCPLMQPAADVMAEALAKVSVKPPLVPLVANVLARPISEPADIVRCLVEQVTGTVRWRESVLFMAQAGVTSFYEIGAGKVLTGLIKRIADGRNGVLDRHARRHRPVQGRARLSYCVAEEG